MKLSADEYFEAFKHEQKLVQVMFLNCISLGTSLYWFIKIDLQFSCCKGSVVIGKLHKCRDVLRLGLWVAKMANTSTNLKRNHKNVSGGWNVICRRSPTLLEHSSAVSLLPRKSFNAIVEGKQSYTRGGKFRYKLKQHKKQISCSLVSRSKFRFSIRFAVVFAQILFDERKMFNLNIKTIMTRNSDPSESPFRFHIFDFGKHDTMYSAYQP